MKLLLAIAMSIGVSLSCFGQSKNAARYNDKIIDIQHAAIEKMARFAGSFSSTPLDILQKEKDKLELMLENDIKKVAAMPPHEGDSELRDAAIDWFIHSKKIIDTDFDEIISIVVKKDKTQDEKQKIKACIERLISEEDEILIKFDKAQENFVQRHGLELVEHSVKL
jgi:hypothetical protein